MTPDAANSPDSCCGCGACAAICPVGSIEMVGDAWGFPCPSIGSSCIGCGLCERVCPLHGDEAMDEVKGAFWARACNEDVLMSSSSGGVFGVLALDVLKMNGVVYGAAFSCDCRTVHHVRICNEDGLDAVMRSKYLQSIADGSIYHQVENDLGEGRDVLFAGTACQIAGLRRFLSVRGMDDGRLLCIEVVCHGVSSPKLWGSWIDFLVSDEQVEIGEVNFRNKSTGWQTFSVSYKYVTEKVDMSRHSSDWYMRAFLANASLRKSCFGCSSKRACGSDITLGDFWGIQSVLPEFDCSKGVSAVICNTAKGIDAFLSSSESMEFGNVSFEDILRGNPAIAKSVSPYVYHAEFMSDVAAGIPMLRMREKWKFEQRLNQKVRKKLGSLKRRFLTFVRRPPVR